jgi:hypothetical protein
MVKSASRKLSGGSGLVDDRANEMVSRHYVFGSHYSFQFEETWQAIQAVARQTGKSFQEWRAPHLPRRSKSGGTLGRTHRTQERHATMLESRGDGNSLSHLGPPRTRRSPESPPSQGLLHIRRKKAAPTIVVSPVAVRAAEVRAGKRACPSSAEQLSERRRQIGGCYLGLFPLMLPGGSGFLLGVLSALQPSISVIASVGPRERILPQSLQPRGSHRGAFFVSEEKAELSARSVGRAGPNRPKRAGPTRTRSPEMFGEKGGPPEVGEDVDGRTPPEYKRQVNQGPRVLNRGERTPGGCS